MTKENGTKKIAVIAGIIVAILALIYVVIAVYYGSHFLPGTKVNEYNCGSRTVTAVNRMLDKETESSMLALQEQDGSVEVIYGHQIGLHVELETSPEELLANQNQWLWLFELLGNNEYRLKQKFVYDEDALNAAVAALKCVNIKSVAEPVDAYIDFSGDTYVIVDDRFGNEVDVEALKMAVADAFSKGTEMINLSELELYKAAKVRKDDAELVKELNRLNQYCGFTIQVPFGDKTEKIGGELINKWLVDGEVSLDKLEDYVIDELATKYNTYGSGVPREFKTTESGVVKIYGGDYGWWLDWKSTSAEIMAAIEEGKDATVDPIWNQTADSFGKNDYGNSYLELSIDKQHVWVYIDGEKVFDAPVTTGNVAKGFDTPKGTQRVMYKAKQQKLVGEGYAELVDYFVVFTTNTGFHDAKWQNESKFGTDYYKYSGSHGCVRMKLKDAETLYGYAEEGMPVFVY